MFLLSVLSQKHAMELIKKANGNIELIVSQPILHSESTVRSPDTGPETTDYRRRVGEAMRQRGRVSDEEEDFSQCSEVAGQQNRDWNQFSQRQITEEEVSLVHVDSYESKLVYYLSVSNPVTRW